jgi:hypothetical protein
LPDTSKYNQEILDKAMGEFYNLGLEKDFPSGGIIEYAKYYRSY